VPAGCRPTEPAGSDSADLPNLFLLPAAFPAWSPWPRSCLQARAEDYCEAVAFVRLLNALWRSSAGAELADEGRGLAHVTKFVREDLLGTAFQRAYREEAQRWQLVAACLEHCELCLAGVRSMAALAGEAAASSSAASLKPPGLEVLLDLLGEWTVRRVGGAPLRERPYSAGCLLVNLKVPPPYCLHVAYPCLCSSCSPSPVLLHLPAWLPAAGERNAMRAAMATMMLEVDQLAHERHAAPYGGCLGTCYPLFPSASGCPVVALFTSLRALPLHPADMRFSQGACSRCLYPRLALLLAGAAKEAAVLAALRLLRCAMDHDAELVNAMRAAQLSGAYPNLMLVCAG
jgi:hypothetical protein